MSVIHCAACNKLLPTLTTKCACGDGQVYYTTDSKLQDSGAREQLDTGAEREPATGKGMPELISPFALDRLAKHYENGAIKYSLRNWEKGIKYSRCLGSALRHLFAFMRNDTTEDHLAAAAWNIFVIMHFQELNETSLDDLPKYQKKV